MNALLHPELWPALFAAPIAWWTLFRADARVAETWREAAGDAARRPGFRVSSPSRVPVARAAAGLGVLCAAVALMNPAWGAAVSAEGGAGGDVVLCLDVSRSMLATDDRPTRLRRAQDEIADLAAIPGGRLALVAFAGEARTVAPLTHDRRTVAEMASLCDDASVATGGSDLGAALKAALSLVPATSDRRAAIVVLTDADRGGDAARAAAAEASARGVAVHVLALGSERGAKIPLDDRAGFLRDRSGRDVVSAADRGMLADVARAGRGSLSEGRAPGALVSLHESRLARIPGPPGTAQRDGPAAPATKAPWFLGAALVLWLADLALRRVR